MNVNTVESLLALGELVAKNMHGNIEKISDWVEKEVKVPDPVDDLAIAAHAAVAKARRSRTTTTEMEGETT